jgi:hypothetical protein
VAGLAIAAGIAAWRPWVAHAHREQPRTGSARDPGSGTFASMRWGSGDGELGHKRPHEGSAEGPMSLAVGPGGDALVVDQVNGRLVRLGPDGSPRGTIRVGEGAEDVALGRDGKVAVLDRLVDRDVTVYAPDGAALGRLPLEGAGIRETGQVTGVFVDGSDVYVEREHAELILLGDASGRPSRARTEIPGRPSHDGSSFVSAGIDFGRVYLTAITRSTGQLRYARPLAASGSVDGILLLDTDRIGTVYLATLGTEPDGTSSEWLTCASLSDGHVIGRTAVNENTLPDETFREFAVLDDGGVLHAEMSDNDVTYVRYHCL